METTCKLTGFLMSKDEIIANIENGRIVEENTNKLPLYLRCHNDLDGWLMGRAIDSHRTNSRILKKALRLQETDDISSVLHVHAATITDTFWIRQKGETLTYKDIVFKQNAYADTALVGSFEGFFVKETHTPELTNTGSFEKCWRWEDGSWWLYKAGTKEEHFSELFIARLGEELGFDMAYYSYNGQFIKSKNFTENGKYNFEPLSSIVGSDDGYDKDFRAIYSINRELAKEYLKTIWLDSVVFNVDRHTNNMGFLRDAETGNIVKMAPNFDNNVALVAKSLGRSRENRSEDPFLQLYVEFLEANSDAKRLHQEIRWPVITKKSIAKALENCNVPVPEETKRFVTNFVLNGYHVLAKETEKSLMPKEETTEKPTKGLSLQTIKKQIRGFDHEARLFLGDTKTVECYIAGDAALLLAGYTNKDSCNIEVLRITNEDTRSLFSKYHLVESQSLQTFPLGFEKRAQYVPLDTEAIRFFRVSAEDTVVSKLCQNKHWQDDEGLSNPHLIQEVNWATLDSLIRNMQYTLASQAQAEELNEKYRQYKSEHCPPDLSHQKEILPEH